MDYTGVIPEKPTDAVRQWAEEHDWKREMLVYRAGRWEEGGKCVDAICSYCMTEMKLPYAPGPECGSYARAPFGFFYGVDAFDARAYQTGNSLLCPCCGHEVQAAHIGSVESYEDHEWPMEPMQINAGGEKRFCLMIWRASRHIGKDGIQRLCAAPWEAYVMEEKSIVRLAHWVPQFYGNVSITDKWRQNKGFKDTARDIDTVIGDIGKAMQGTYAENSKLDLYMKMKAVRFPVSYLRMYQKHGNIETLLTCGAGKLLAMLMEQEKKENIQSYRELYGNRIPKIEEIDWKAKRPSHMLRMTRGELRTELRDKKLNANGLRNFLAARKGGAPVDITEDAETLNRMEGRGIRRILAHGQNPKRAENYLKGQNRRFTGEDVTLTELADYWDMLKEKSRETMYPAHLRRAHDQLVMQQEFRENKELCGKFAKQYQKLKKYCFAADGLEVFPPIKESDLIREGKVLDHCVASYAESHAKGETIILFIRRENDREMPFYTLNLDKTGKKVIQNRGKRNQKQTPEIQAFEDRFMAWVRGGCRRDKDGKPIEEKERKTA